MKRKFIFFSVLCFTILFTLTGCGNKKAITSDEFKTKLQNKGYTVQDLTEKYSSYDHIKHVLIALDSENNYQIEFYEINNLDNAVSVYNENKSIFEKSKSSSSAETSVEMGNNAKYTLKTNGTYKAVSRIDKTVVYVNVNSKYENSVKDVLKEIGY